MRTPSQTRKAVEADLKHLTTALDRAKANTLRPKDQNVRIVQLLSELVRTLTEEVTREAEKQVKIINHASLGNGV